MKTIEEPMNEYETVNEPEEGAIPDSEAEAAAGGYTPFRKEIKYRKVNFYCDNKACSRYTKSCQLSENLNPICHICHQPLKKGYPH